MEESRVAPKGRAHHLFHGESRIVEQGPVRVKGSATRAEDDDNLGYGVDDAPQLLLVLSQLASARLRSSISVFVPYQWRTLPCSSRMGSTRTMNQRYWPS